MILKINNLIKMKNLLKKTKEILNDVEIWLNSKTSSNSDTFWIMHSSRSNNWVAYNKTLSNSDTVWMMHSSRPNNWVAYKK
jgi:hypothetical protein